MKERLSPNMEPPMTDPMQRAGSNPEADDTAMAIGVINVMVPTEVPIAVDTKQETTNRIATENFAGIRDSIK